MRYKPGDKVVLINDENDLSCLQLYEIYTVEDCCGDGYGEGTKYLILEEIGDSDQGWFEWRFISLNSLLGEIVIDVQDRG